MPQFLILLFLLIPTTTALHTPYITHSFTFPHIPYHCGLRHIHTPERCVEPYALLPPEFCITATSAPRRVSTYDTVDFRFTTALSQTPHHGTMFTCSPECSQLLLMDARGAAYMLVSYSVRAYVPRATVPFEGGHTLVITGTYLRTPSELELLLTQRLVRKEVVQSCIQVHRSASEDRNLKMYRHQVLRF